MGLILRLKLRNSYLVIVFSLSVARIGEVKRVTKETNVSVKINLDGTGVADNNTGIPFLDHMLDVSLFQLLLLSFLDF